MSKRVVAILLAVLCASSVAPAKDAEFSVDIFFGWGNYYRPMEWTPIEVGIQSDLTEAFAGRFAISAPQDGLNRLNVNHKFVLTPKLREAFPLVTKLAFGKGDCTLSVLDDRGRRMWSLAVDTWDRSTLRVVQDTDLLIGTAGWPRFGLSSLHQKTESMSDRGEGRVCWGRKDLNMLPWDWTGYVSLDVLVLYDPDWMAFRTEQLQAISEWVSNGGALFVVLGQHPLPAGSPLAQMIPFHIGELREVQVPGEALERWELDAGVTETVKAWPMFSRSDAVLTETVKMDQGGFLYGLGPVGFGRVAVLSFDPEQLGQDQRTHTAEFWVHHLATCLEDESLSRSGERITDRLSRNRNPNGAGMERTIVMSALTEEERLARYRHRDNRYEISIADAASNRVMEHLYELKQMEPLSIWWVILILALLALLLGPVDYLVLKRLDRLPYTWLTSTGWIVIFTVGAYYGVQALRGGRMQLRAVSVVDGVAGSQSYWGTHYLGLFSPRSSDYQLTGLGPGQWWSGVAPTQDVIYGYRHQSATRQIHCRQEDGANIPVSVPINIWTVQTLLNESPLDTMPFTAEVERRGKTVHVEIENTSDYPIASGYVLLENGCIEIGSVGARSQRQFELPMRPFNPWGGSHVRQSRGSHRRPVPFAMPEFNSALGDWTRSVFLAKGTLGRTVAIYEYLNRGGALVCVEFDDVPPPFGVKDRSYDVNHVQLARLIVFPRDGG